MSFQVPKSIVFKEIDEDSIVLNLDTGEYYTMNEMATQMWKLLQEFDSLNEIVNFLVTEYQVSYEEVHQDLLALVMEWKSKGLIEENLKD